MEELEGHVAVVTGAASGIGFAMAERFGAEGMKVVLADVEEPALAAAEKKLKDSGVTTLSAATDVSKWEDVEALAGRAFDKFGAVHVICNNAGVGGGGRATALWNKSLEEWRWVMGVNLWGVIHGVRAFVPRMIEQGDEGHVVNTASMAGLVLGGGIYGVTKHGVVALSESLYRQFAMAKTKLGVSVLCPGFVNTNIWDSQRNRPEDLQADEPELPPEEAQQRLDQARQMLGSGLAPSEVAEAVVVGIRERQFYVVPTQPQLKEGIRRRVEAMMAERNPDTQGW